MNSNSKNVFEPSLQAQHLRPPILFNAVFSGAIGLLLLMAPRTIAAWLGPQVIGTYNFLGAGLLLFSLTLCLVAIHPTPVTILVISCADVGWIISTGLAVLIWRDEFTFLGHGVVWGANVIVLTLAWFQLSSIQKAFRVRDGAPDEYEVCIFVNAPVSADSFWHVLADLGAIKRYMPGLRSSMITVGEKSGIGCVRTCENVKGQVWSERCVEWEEGASFSVIFSATDPHFPFPFSKMHGGWRVAPSEAGCRVQVWWRVVPRRSWLAPLLLPVMAADAQRNFSSVISRMALATKGVQLDSSTQSKLPRLRAVLC